MSTMRTISCQQVTEAVSITTVEVTAIRLAGMAGISVPEPKRVFEVYCEHCDKFFTNGQLIDAMIEVGNHKHGEGE